MCYQYQGSTKFEKALFQYFERRNIEIVRGFIEEQDVGWLQHQFCKQNPRSFPAGEPAHRLVQLLIREQESRGPRRHVNRPVLIYNRVSVRGERTKQSEFRIERSVLIEVDNPQ